MKPHHHNYMMTEAPAPFGFRIGKEVNKELKKREFYTQIKRRIRMLKNFFTGNT